MQKPIEFHLPHYEIPQLSPHYCRHLFPDELCFAHILQCKKVKKNIAKSHQSGPGNDWFRVSTSDTNQSDIVSFVRFVQTVARSFHNTWRICKKHQILHSHYFH